MSASDHLNPEQFTYRINHRPANPWSGSGAPLHQADDVMPDITGPKGEQYYGSTSPEWKRIQAESFRQIRAAKGNPDAEVRIYRAVPKVEYGINPGDWVTPSRKYAERHAIQDDDPSHDWPVVTGRAKAYELYGHGDDPNEWGYWPADTPR